MDSELTSRYWLVRKTICVLGYFGGLRNIELRSIEFNKISETGEPSFEVDQAGYWFRFERAKQRGMPDSSVFCVPRRQSDWVTPVSGSDRNPVDYDPASVVDQYLETLQFDLNTSQEKLTGPFFKSAHGKKASVFRRTPMGKTLISRVGFEFATELLIPNPQGFTGHCWRRSCGTNASDAGVNVTTLMAQLGWSTPKTAIGYVKKSRMTSFQMSMFLSNVQRQNKDLDQVLYKVNPSLVPLSSKRKSSGQAQNAASSSAQSKNPASSSAQSKNPAPSSFNSELSSKLATGLAAARLSESSARTAEELLLDSERSAVLSAINSSSEPEQQEVNKDVSGGGSVLGGGGGEVRVGMGNSNYGRGSGEEVRVGDRVDGVGLPSNATVQSLDPRISSILSRLSADSRGDLHVHFHFGGQ